MFELFSGYYAAALPPKNIPKKQVVKAGSRLQKKRSLRVEEFERLRILEDLNI
jgi:hypothetical protein